MKHYYNYLVFYMLIFFGTLGYGQVLINEDFDAGTSFSQGWVSPTFPAFLITSSNSCDGNSARGLLNLSSVAPVLAYESQVTVGEDIEVSFDYKIMRNNTVNPTATDEDFGSFKLQYSIDNGRSWVTYYTIDQSNHRPSINCTTITHTISAIDIPANSNFGWRIKGDYKQGDNYIYIDNFTAIEQVSCLQPVDVIIERVTFNSIELSWSELNTSPATKWEIAYCSEGINPSNPACLLSNTVTVTSNPYTITGLPEGEKFDIYVRSVCSTSDSSAWTGPIKTQTTAVGIDCNSPINVNSLPFNHSSNTEIYESSYKGAPGSVFGCGTSGMFLEGNDVVYHYDSAKEDIIQIKLSGNLSGSVGVFVYEACSDIGSNCFAGSITDNGNSIELSDLYLEKDQDYYIVISTAGTNTATEYLLEVTGLDCTRMELPAGNSKYNFLNQTLKNYSETRIGVHPTIKGAELTWYSDAALTNEITNLSSIILNDKDEFWVTQTVLNCTSSALHIRFDEFDCDKLSVTSMEAASQICNKGTTTLIAEASTNNLIWYDQETGGQPIGIGHSLEIPEITETTSFWVSEFFMGESLLTKQANLGPIRNTDSNYSNVGVEFELTEPILLMDVEVFITGASGSLTIQLEDNKGPVISKTVVVPEGSLNHPTPFTIPLEFNITDPSQGPFKLTKTYGPSMLITMGADADFPYALGDFGEVTKGVGNTNYNYFYSWTLSSEMPLCESSRVQVDAVVNKIQSIKVDAKNYNVCIGSKAELSVESVDKNYEYTWKWYDHNGDKQALTGDSIEPIINQGTTFSINALNPITGCSIEDEIYIGAVGVGEIPVVPITKTICSGEIVELRAGQISFTFEDTITDWTYVNNSSPAINTSVESAGWQQVSSPYTLADNATSNDNSSFMITMADPLGPGSKVDTEMISPIINLVGLQGAVLEFYHYYKHHTTKATMARVEVSDDAGLTWTTLDTYTTSQGSETDFEKVTLDLKQYLGSPNVQIKFKYTGDWGWWWAIDNVSVSQTYMNGQIVWDGIGIENLYLDELASISYQGQPANMVYFKGDESGEFQFDANLLVGGCTESVSNTVVLEVEKTDIPKGDAEQSFVAGSRVSDIDVVGSKLMFYILKDGEYERQSINAQLINNETYYISQKVNNCRSDYLKVAVSYICPDATDLSVSVDWSEDSSTSVTAIVYWDAPINSIGLEGYQLFVKDDNGNIIKDIYLSSSKNYQIIESLRLNSHFTVELFSVCDTENNVYGNTLKKDFNTNNLNVRKLENTDFKFYPNPVLDILHVDSDYLITKLEIFDFEGKLVYSKEKLSTTKTNINISNIPTGTYLLVATSETKSKVVRLIKK